MTSRLAHFSASDLEDAILELQGLKTTAKDRGWQKLVECLRCATGIH